MCLKSTVVSFLVQNKDDIEKLVKKNLDLEMEVSALRGFFSYIFLTISCHAFILHN